jgi:hypothetical protein
MILSILNFFVVPLKHEILDYNNLQTNTFQPSINVVKAMTRQASCRTNEYLIQFTLGFAKCCAHQLDATAR